MKTKCCLALNIFFLGALVFGLPQRTSAQNQDQYPQDQQYQQQDQQDPPSRVARLDDAEGSVSYEPQGAQDWVQADLNRPLTTGDNLWSDQSSRAELHIGSTSFRMGDQTGISFLNLNDQAVQIQLAQGSLEVDLRHLLLIRLFQLTRNRVIVRPRWGFSQVGCAAYFFVFGRLVPSSKAEQRLKRRHRGLPAIVSKYEFIQVKLELTTAHAVVSSDEPLLEVANCSVRQWYNGLCALPQVNAQRLAARNVLEASLFQPGKAFQSVRVYRRTRRHVGFEEGQ